MVDLIDLNMPIKLGPRLIYHREGNRRNYAPTQTKSI